MSMRKDNDRKVGQTERFSIDEALHSLDKKELFDLLQDILEQKPEIFKLILEWFKEKQKTSPEKGTKKTSINDELLMEYWSDAREIISKFNEYGGGSEDDEDEACSYLNRISDISNEGNISTAAKIRFLDDAFEEYNNDNSGLEDAMMDVFFEICQTKEEWEHLIKKLDEHPSDWRKKLMMDIQKEHLHNDKAYLAERMKKLHYGMDYWDLAKFYVEKGDIKKAVEIAEEGLLKGEGRQTELFEFLSDHYANSQDTANLERVVQRAIKKNSDEKEMLDRLFEYYKAQNDYENAKRAILKSFEYVKKAGYIPEVRSYVHYNKMKMFLVEADWKKIEPKIIQEVREKDLEDYMRICLDKNMKKEVIDILLNPPKKRPGFGHFSDREYDFDEFANRLKKEFPEDIIKYYWQKAYNYIQNGNRDTYRIAARYLGMVKHIYINVLNEKSKWEQRFSSLKVEFKKRPAFLEELNNYERKEHDDLDD